MENNTTSEPLPQEAHIPQQEPSSSTSSSKTRRFSKPLQFLRSRGNSTTSNSTQVSSEANKEDQLSNLEHPPSETEKQNKRKGRRQRSATLQNHATPNKDEESNNHQDEATPHQHEHQPYSGKKPSLINTAATRIRRLSAPLLPSSSRRRSPSATVAPEVIQETSIEFREPWRNINVDNVTGTRLTTDLAQGVAKMLPMRYQIGDWNLLYSTQRDGTSLNTLYRSCDTSACTTTGTNATRRPTRQHSGGTAGSNSTSTGGAPRVRGHVLVVWDINGNIFGGFSRKPFKKEKLYQHASRDNGDAFLFTIQPNYKSFEWTGVNNYIMMATDEGLYMGIGEDSAYGLWINPALNMGTTAPTATFDNTHLVPTEEDSLKSTPFEIARVEVWGIDV